MAWHRLPSYYIAYSIRKASPAVCSFFVGVCTVNPNVLTLQLFAYFLRSRPISSRLLFSFLFCLLLSSLQFTFLSIYVNQIDGKAAYQELNGRVHRLWLSGVSRLRVCELTLTLFLLSSLFEIRKVSASQEIPQSNALKLIREQEREDKMPSSRNVLSVTASARGQHSQRRLLLHRHTQRQWRCGV